MDKLSVSGRQIAPWRGGRIGSSDYLRTGYNHTYLPPRADTSPDCRNGVSKRPFPNGSLGTRIKREFGNEGKTPHSISWDNKTYRGRFMENEALRVALAEALSGKVGFGKGERALYATDASVYQ